MNVKLATVVTFLCLGVVVVVASVNPQTVSPKPDLEPQSIIGALAAIFVVLTCVERFAELVKNIWCGVETDTSETRRVVLLAQVSAAFIVCAAGVGIMDTFFIVKSGNPAFVRGIDIVLTSALIAGGGEVFHQFIKGLRAIFVGWRKRTENQRCDGGQP